jgi:uncharacterized protein (DUF305 family)
VSQTKEIDTLSGWLRDWGEPVPETGFATGDSHSHDTEASMGAGSHGDMPGMMSGKEMEALATAPDARFQQLWLTMMIEHHAGAIDMAEQVVADGQSADVEALAEEIRDAQAAELDKMQVWRKAS